MIRVGDIIPDIQSMNKIGTTTIWQTTHEIFKDKKILLIGLPGLFLVEYAASQLRTYDFYA
jgi:peroxiredoxin